MPVLLVVTVGLFVPVPVLEDVTEGVMVCEDDPVAVPVPVPV